MLSWESLNIVVNISEVLNENGVNDTCRAISDSFNAELISCNLENEDGFHEILLKLLVSNIQFIDIIDSVESDNFLQLLNVTEEVNFYTIAAFSGNL